MILDFSVLPPAWQWGLCLSVAALIGSFLTVFTTRIARRFLREAGPTTLGGRSLCPHCGTLIPLARNIPLVTYVLQRGRAACCDAKIPPNYFILELSSVMLAMAAIYDYGFTWTALAGYLLMVATLAGCCIHLRLIKRRRGGH